MAIFCATLLLVTGCGGDDENGAAPAETAPTATGAGSGRADLSGVKDYLLEHTELLSTFTGDFKSAAESYQEVVGGEPEQLEQGKSDQAATLVAELKQLWIDGNPAYERMEGVVAGTPSLAEFDVILDAGSSAADDPASAVPFDLELADGRSLEQPGNLFNLAEGALWGTLPADLAEVQSTPVDLDGDGKQEFGEVLPDPAFLLAVAEEFDSTALELADAGEAWEPTESDAFTALVVMVPTMNEYFGQWKESRFVAGAASDSAAFNVVSRLSDIRDILTGLDVVYEGVHPRVATVDEPLGSQIDRELADLTAFVQDLHDQEESGKRFTTQEADTLGTEAQERATAIAGQVSQAAARLGVEIEQ